MNQLTFADGPPVPLLVEAKLDEATVRQLFADLQAAADILSIREKGHATDYAAPHELTLATAAPRLLAGACRSLQLRYRFDDVEWTDTLRAGPEGFQLVRCRHESSE